MENRNDEIDLIELFLKMYVFFKKNFWFLFICGFIGAGLGFSTKFFTKKQFESSMLLNSYTISGNLLIEYITNINDIIEDKNLSYLGERMEIDTLVLKNLNEISIKEIFDKKEENSKGYYMVSVKTTNNNLLKSLAQGILKFIEKEPFVKTEISNFIENNKNLITKIDEEIGKLEILQESSLKPTQYKGDVNIYNDQKSFQSERLSLIKEKQNLETILKFAVPFRIIQDFTIYQKPKGKTKTYTLIGGFAFGFIALFYLIIRNINRSLKEKEL